MKTGEKHKQACKRFRKWFLSEHGYHFCEVCGVSNAFVYDPHHLYFASQYPKHPHLHDFRNIVMVCRKCHEDFHAGKNKEVFERLEKERGLKKLFTLSQ